eukprot:TRINITY_DN7928_c0_g1_i16.p1 TRINITY_DN7928_c0_g1~~TRINITY_DN7928_c0_g1_i16.p1  ORF type:complete len:158 (+),score=33.69 TRINITY_DN7928_c0_g1_i16:425-898(+)
MVEELRQEFLQTFPELAKSPHSNAPFSADKRYLNGLCKKYNDLSGNRTLEEAKGKVEGAKTIMKENVISLMGNKEQVAVWCEVKVEIGGEHECVCRPGQTLRRKQPPHSTKLQVGTNQVLGSDDMCCGLLYSFHHVVRSLTTQALSLIHISEPTRPY